MAVIAVGTARNVRGSFPGCRNAVVTVTAFAQYLCVINSESRCPYIRVVAILADICCQHVRDILAGRFDAVVAADAVTHDVHVVEVRWKPSNC